MFYKLENQQAYDDRFLGCVWVMVFNATLDTISVISWWSVLL